jgi:hypothetical protein
MGIQSHKGHDIGIRAVRFKAALTIAYAARAALSDMIPQAVTVICEGSRVHWFCEAVANIICYFNHRIGYDVFVAWQSGMSSPLARCSPWEFPYRLSSGLRTNVGARSFVLGSDSKSPLPAGRLTISL